MGLFEDIAEEIAQKIRLEQEEKQRAGRPPFRGWEPPREPPGFEEVFGYGPPPWSGPPPKSAYDPPNDGPSPFQQAYERKFGRGATYDFNNTRSRVRGFYDDVEIPEGHDKLHSRRYAFMAADTLAIDLPRGESDRILYFAPDRTEMGNYAEMRKEQLRMERDFSIINVKGHVVR